MDAFEVLQTTLGPALRAVEQGNQNRLLIARDQMEQNFRREQLQREQDFRVGEQERDQTFRKGEQERTQLFQKSERESGQKFTIDTEERQRKYKKSDERDSAIDRAITAGMPAKDAMAMSKEDLTAALPRLEAQKKVREEEWRILNDAKLFNVATNDPTTGRPRTINEIELENIKARDSRKTQAEFAASQEKLRLGKTAEGFDNVVQNYAKTLIEKQAAISDATRDAPKLSDMSHQGKAQMARLYALDSGIATAVRKLPMGPALYKRLQAGDPDALDQAIEAVSKLPNNKKGNELRMEFQGAAMMFNQNAGQYLTQDREYGGEVKAYLNQIMKLPQMVQSYDKRLEDMEKAYPALLQENHFDLIEKYKSKFSPFEREQFGNPITRNGPTALPERGPTPLPGQIPLPGQSRSIGNSGVASDPSLPGAVIGGAQDQVSAPAHQIGYSSEPYGPSMADAPYAVVKSALSARADELMRQQGRTAGQAVMGPLYEEVGGALNVQPSPLGGSAFYRTPGSIVQSDLDKYGPQFDALPEGVRNQLMLNAISQSYKNPEYRTPVFNWQRSPTNTTSIPPTPAQVQPMQYGALADRPSMGEAPYDVVRNALVSRANELIQEQGRRGSEAVMSPFYAGAADALNMQPAQIGASTMYQPAASVLASHLDKYGPQFDALPEDVKKTLILNAIMQSYQNPSYRNPIFNWQYSPAVNQ